MQIKCLDKFKPLIERPKPIKIMVGGRGSTKSSFTSARVSAGMVMGERWACGREFLNSVEESVHQDLSREIHRLDLPGFDIQKARIIHASGGNAFYVSLSRNLLSLKGKLTGANLWIEEGEGLSDDSIRIGFPSVRLPQEEAEQLIERYQREHNMSLMEAAAAIPKPEIWVTMNRGSREDPISKHYLARAEAGLARRGWYEDEEVLIVQANYTDVPKSWFMASGLEEKRLADKKRLSTKMYRHKWHGEYLEIVDNAIIKEEWFDACVDAHVKLDFKPEGFEVVAHDPSDDGDDTKGLAHLHGNVFVDIQEKDNGNVNDGMDWAIDYVKKSKPDHFIWDGDGLGLGLRRQADTAFGGKKSISYSMFRGGEIPDMPDSLYNPSGFDNEEDCKINREIILNKRAQYYKYLSDRMYNTFVAVNTGTRFDPDKLISFNSGNIDSGIISKLRAELCRLPLKPGATKFQLMSKEQMKSKLGIPSPNLADSVMMALKPEADTSDDWGDLDYNDEFIP